MKNIVTALILLTSPVMAQSPTVVYGASEDAPGHPDQFMVIQPDDAPNPLGDPIVLPQTSEQNTPTTEPAPTQPTDSQPDTDAQPEPTIINQDAVQNPPPFSESTRQQENQIQNTLYQGGDRIYDVQSYPLKDIKTITEPNIQPTITTYPEY